MLELLLGLAFLVLMVPVFRSVARGSSLLEPEFAIPCLLILGYLLLPVVLVFRGDLDGIAPDFRDRIFVTDGSIRTTVVLVAAAAVAFVAGFYVATSRRRELSATNDGMHLITPFRLLLAFTAVCVAAVLSGGTAWLVGDWSESDGAAPLVVLAQILTVPAIVLAGVLEPRPGTGRWKMLLWSLPLLVTSTLITSRSLMFPLLLFVVARELTKRTRVRAGILWIPVVAVLGVTIGLVMRASVAAGNERRVGTIASAVGNASEDSDLSNMLLYGTSAVPATVLAVSAREQETTVDTSAYLRMLLPIPSSMLQVDTDVVNLARRYGIGGIGIPMPVLGELYFFFRWAGVVVSALLVGMFYGAIQRRLDGGVLGGAGVVMYVVSLYALLLSLHSGVRASTRHILYTAAILLALRILVHVSGYWRAAAPVARPRQWTSR